MLRWMTPVLECKTGRYTKAAAVFEVRRETRLDICLAAKSPRVSEMMLRSARVSILP